MTAEYDNRARELFTAALEKPPAERSIFLELACGSDHELRQAVASLLASYNGETPTKSGPVSRRLIGRYEIEKELGAGGMGVVCLARDSVLQRRVALKSVLGGGSTTTDQQWFHDRLLREARAAAALSHPGIAALHDVFDDQGVTYVVMEFVEGASVADLIKAQKRPHDWTLSVIRQAAEALDHAHQKGIIHRDIKPANLLVDSRGVTKIVDFGIAKIVTADTQTTKGLVIGTMEYMSPEQINAQPLTGRADQYSLAAMAYRMLTGGPMFPAADTLASLSYKHCFENPAPPSQIVADLPQSVDEVFAQALSKKAEKRYATCSEFAQALVSAMQSPVRLASAPTTELFQNYVPEPSTEKSSALRRGLAVGGLSIVGAGIVFWAVTGWNPSRPGPVTNAVQSTNPQPVAIPKPQSTEVTASQPVKPGTVSQTTKTPVVSTDTKPPYRGPSSGQLVWTGTLAAGASLVLTPKSPEVSGAFLPGVPIDLEITPAVVEITSRPANTNHWTTLGLRNATTRPQNLIIVKWKVR